MMIKATLKGQRLITIYDHHFFLTQYSGKGTVYCNWNERIPAQSEKYFHLTLKYTSVHMWSIQVSSTLSQFWVFSVRHFLIRYFRQNYAVFLVLQYIHLTAAGYFAVLSVIWITLNQKLNILTLF